MTRPILNISETVVRSFKANIRPHRSRYLQKAISRLIIIKDAFKPQMKTYITVFLPKLTPTFLKPVIMLSISNGNGSVLIRLGNIAELEILLEKLTSIIHSDRFYETYERLDKLSDNIIMGENLITDKALFQDDENSLVLFKK